MSRLINILNAGEGISVEFKESQQRLPSSLFESICAMLNRSGGDILLGVDDDRNVLGVPENVIDNQLSQIVSLSNNPQKLDPAFILFPKKVVLDGKNMIHIQVPQSSQVHRTAGKIYDRSDDGDFELREPQAIANLYNSKRNHFTECTIYPYVTIGDFDPTSIEKARNRIRSNNSSHPWLNLSDMDLMVKAGLWQSNPQTNTEGFTLASVLLFGTETLILNVLPQYKIDALKRVENVDRYDDRDYITCNLVEAYERLMNFVEKHLSDKFFMIDDQRVSLRSKIFREVVANLLVHREYTSGHSASLTVFRDKVVTLNANNPNGFGEIQPDDFVPHSKNPLIAKFFIQLGHVDELGSGILNVNKWIKEYTPGGVPHFIEGSMFKTEIPIVPIGGGVNVGANVGVNVGVNVGAENDQITALIETNFQQESNRTKENLIKVLRVIQEQEGRNSKQLESSANVGVRRTLERYLKLLRDAEIIEFKGTQNQGGYFIKKESKEG